MKKSRILQALLFLLTAGSGFGVVANDHSGPYFGVQYAMTEEDNIDLEPTAAVLRVGNLTDQGFGYEFRIGTGISSDDTSENLPFFGETSLELEIDYLVGLYLLAEAQMGAGSIYGIIGYSQITYTLDVDSELLSCCDSDTEDESGWSYGFGANFDVSDKVGLNIEFMQYLDTDDVEASAISVGVLF
jgi:opacity protein-like surface antigen